MEDFSIDWTKTPKEPPKETQKEPQKETPGTPKNGDVLNMQVSLACKKDGRKVVYVTFADKTRFAEGEIPSCKITTNRGFTPEEVGNLETYLRENMDELNRTAAGIDPIRALFT